MVMTGMDTTMAAASANINVVSASCEKGKTVTVKVKVSTSVDMAIYQYYLNYDSSILEYQSGDHDAKKKGQLTILKDSASGTSQTLSFTFKALAVGTSKITISGAMVCPSDPKNGDELPVTISNGSVTVKAPYQASTNANLKSLSVGQGTISPAFKKDTYNYTLSVGGGVDRVTVSAVAEDSKAKVSISGNTSLKAGDNVVTITVTAEDGKTKKTYKITVTRAKPSPTMSPTPTLSPTPTATPTPGIEVPVGDGKLTLSDVITVEYPEGYEEDEFEYEGITVQALKSLAGDLTLVQLSDGKLYLYCPADGSFVPYRVISEQKRTYTIIPKPVSAVVPEGFTETKTTLHEEEITVYAANENAEYFLVYAMNWDGKSGWYCFDTVEETLQRYDTSESGEIEVTPTPSPEPSPVPTDTPSPTPTEAMAAPGESETVTPTPEVKETAISRPMETWILLGTSGGLLVLTLLFLGLFIREKNRHVESVEASSAEEVRISAAELEGAATVEEVKIAAAEKAEEKKNENGD